jgi:pimeloyl-ACP methyl ester carboxylesterase
METQNFINRRSFLGLAAMGTAIAQFTGISSLRANPADKRSVKVPNSASVLRTFNQIRQVKTSVLDIGYVDEGPATGPVVILLHGWPYDIHSFADVSSMLTARGFRVIIPHLRGHGTTKFLSGQTARNGQQAAIASDIIELMDALKIKTAVIGGFDWGARTADIIAALWPERCKGLISVSGYLIGSQEGNKKPIPPIAEQSWWYQYYFATERGREGYKANTNDFAKLIWQTASPKWIFDEATFSRSAASFVNPDHVDIVIHNYRWRLGLAEGERKYDAYEKKLAAFPGITVPAITLEGDANGAPHPKPADYASRFKNKYKHYTIDGGIGHNLPQEAPKAFADAIVEVAAMAAQG